MQNVRYELKHITPTGVEYVEILDSDMKDLMQRSIMILAKYAECTIVKNSNVLDTSKDLFGGRKGGKANNRLSLLGGFVYNYFTKEPRFRNHISKSQIPFIENVLNEYAESLDEEKIRFVINH